MQQTHFTAIGGGAARTWQPDYRTIVDAKTAIQMSQAGIDLNVPDKEGANLAHYIKDAGMLEELVKGGYLCASSLAEIDHTGRTPLHYPKTQEAIAVHTYHGADLFHRNVHGFTALHCAQDVEHLEALLQVAGERAATLVNIPDTMGRTPLFYHRSPKATELLLRAGADPNVQDKDKFTPLGYFCIDDYPPKGDGCRDLSALNSRSRLLKNAGARYDVYDKHGFTPSMRLTAASAMPVTASTEDHNNRLLAVRAQEEKKAGMARKA